MSRKKTSDSLPAGNETTPVRDREEVKTTPQIVHLATEVKVQLGVLDGDNVRALPTLDYSLSRLDPDALTELLGRVNAQRQEAIAVLTGALAPQGEPATPVDPSLN